MTSIEVMHGAFFPSDQPGALGVLSGVDIDDGERLSVVVDPEWLRTLLMAMDADVEMGLLDIPEAVMLPIAAPGWEEDWGDADRAEMSHHSHRGGRNRRAR